MLRIILILLLLMLLATILVGEEVSTEDFPATYLPEDFIHEVIEEAPPPLVIEGNGAKNPVTLSVDDLPRAGASLRPISKPGCGCAAFWWCGAGEKKTA